MCIGLLSSRLQVSFRWIQQLIGFLMFPRLLGLHVYKLYLHWVPKSLNISCIGPFGASWVIMKYVEVFLRRSGTCMCYACFICQLFKIAPSCLKRPQPCYIFSLNTALQWGQNGRHCICGLYVAQLERPTQALTRLMLNFRVSQTGAST